MGKRVLRRKKSVLRRLAGVLYGLLVALSAVIVALYVIYNVMKEEPTMPPAEPPPVASGQQDPQTSADPQGLTRKEGTYTVLLTCPDVASGNADTIMVAMYDTVNQKAGLVSIPRDTLVEGESPGGNRYYKINSSYHYGIDELKETVSDLLGIPIDYYVSIDVETFPKLVDMVGGVDFEIRCTWTTRTPLRTCILLPAGNDPSGRPGGHGGLPLPPQQRGRPRWPIPTWSAPRPNSRSSPSSPKKSSPSRTISPATRAHRPECGDRLGLGEMLWFVEPALGFDLSTGLSTATLPGDGRSPITAGPTAMRSIRRRLEILNEMLNPYTTPITLEMTNIVQAS